ncbi:MAG: hypothetical protein JSW66_16330 [Phycisphaerales bacterium]|nr:MAG: hypothetical protein JSW66_16330 [Phycisphaerales bacterium]
MVNSRITRNALLAGTVVLLVAGGVWAATSAKPRAAGLLGAIPARSLFCVRINEFDGTLETVNEFLKGVAPASFDAQEEVMSKLGKLLGDERFRGVNRKGNFAIFAVNVQGKSANPGPMGNMFIGALLPVRNYDNFVSKNPNCGQPDDEGIATITVDGKARALVTNFRRFALVCPPEGREKLIRVKKMLAQRKRSLGVSLDADAVKQASSSPVWVYLNVKQGSQMIQPLLFGKLEQVKAQLEKAKESGEELPMDPAGIIGFYGGIFKTVLDGTESVTVALAPSAEACNVTLGLKPVPDSMMAAIVGEPPDGDLESMMGYLENGSIFNLATKVDRESLKTTYAELFKLMGNMIPGGLDEADLEQLKELMAKGIDAMGDSLAITFGVNNEVSPPFAGKYVIEVKDQPAFEQVLEEELQLMEKGVFADLYKGFGMEMDVEIDRDAGTYRGVQIGGAKVGFKAGGDSAMQAKMFETMFGDGIDYRWAFEKGNCVYTVGADADGTIRELIDQVRAGGPKGIGSEARAALEAIGESEKADAVGTLNYVRAISMAFGFMPLPEDFDTTQLEMDSKSNIAFAGRTTAEGNLALQIVLPREHLLEIKSVFDNIIPKIKEQERLQRQKQKERAQANSM